VYFVKRAFWIGVLLPLSALLALPAATVPPAPTATQTTGTNPERPDAKSDPSRLHSVAENLKDVAVIASGAFTSILAFVAAVLISKRGRVMILGAVLDGLAADPASAKRLYEGILLSEKTFEHILGGVLDGISADQTRAHRIYDCVMKVDDDRAKIYDRVIAADQSRGMITTTVIRRLSEDSNSIRQLLNLIVGEFGGNRSKDFAELLSRRENQQIIKAMQDIRAVTAPQDPAHKDAI
jgi:hypothetical protein